MKKHSLTSQERILFIKRLSLFLRAGIPIHAAFDLINAGMKRPASKRLITTLSEEIRAGKTLAAAFALFPRTFDPLVVGFIRIGEASGALTEHTAQVAHLLEKRAAMARTVVSAALYPLVIMSATLGVTIFLALYAFPKILPLFKDFNQRLPLSTRILIAGTDALTHYGWLLLAATVVLLGTGLYIQRYARVRTIQDAALLYLPFFGTMIQHYHIATLARTLSSLLSRGVPMLVALELVEQAVRHSTYKAALVCVRTSITTGRRMSEQFTAHSNLFPLVLAQMTEAGEVTGTLPESLRSCAEIYEEYLGEEARLLSTLVEPALMIVMGLMVGFVALAIITPIYGLTQGLTPQ